jgi:1-pyrroline-5-carboxylate dehydrogenase
MNKFLLKAQPRMTLFTGSGRVAEKLARELHGRIKIEDAGFDWKVLGPDVALPALDYTAWVCDQDAYACAGQKCSAQSILFAHTNWARAGLYDRLAALAARRKLSDLTAGPVLTWTTEAMLTHVRKLAAIPGARVMFGGKELNGGKHTIPKVYGALEPTAVFVPLKELVKPGNYELATTEVFGPVQVVTEWADGEVHLVQDALERMTHNLTAGIVSNDPIFM